MSTSEKTRLRLEALRLAVELRHSKNLQIHQGDKGEPGLVGPAGERGLQGEPGPQGPVGNDGAEGPEGKRGAQGQPGPVGAQGPVGPPGPQGGRGPEGADGKDGEQGEPGIVWRGPYQQGTRYAPGDAVSNQGSSWIAKFETSSFPGPGAADWDLLAQRGADGIAYGQVISEGGGGDLSEVESRLDALEAEPDLTGDILAIDARVDAIETGTVVLGAVQNGGAYTGEATFTDADITAGANEFINADASFTGLELIVTLPPVAGLAGRQYTVKKVDSSEYPVIVRGTGGQAIEDESEWVLADQYQSATFVCDGTQWLVSASTVGLGLGGKVEALDEGVSLTSEMLSIDFVGAGVTASGSDHIIVNIPGTDLSAVEASIAAETAARVAADSALDTRVSQISPAAQFLAVAIFGGF